jgi:AraC family transcriptional regulator of adaptative response / DNA-3-methyladenine glycosylase II
VAAGYRPCARCLPERHGAWKRAELPARTPFAGAELVAYLAARAVPGVETAAGATLRRTLGLPHGPGAVALTPHADGVAVELSLRDLRDRDAALAACRRLLDLDADPVAIGAVLGRDPALAPLVARVPGRRSPGAVDPWEILVRAIVGQQISLAAARTVLGRLAAQHGARYGGRRLFPGPERLAEAAGLPMPRARGETLRRVAARVAGDELDVRDTDALLAERGIGPWTVAYVRMRGLGDPDVLVAGDLGLRRALQALGLSAARAQAWRPWRSYATHHLWAAPR